MKKQAVFILVTGLLLAPMLFRAAFPYLYTHIWQSYPFTGLALVALLDIVWLWLTLLVMMLSARFIRWISPKLSRVPNLEK